MSVVILVVAPIARVAAGGDRRESGCGVGDAVV